MRGSPRRSTARSALASGVVVALVCATALLGHVSVADAQTLARTTAAAASDSCATVAQPDRVDVYYFHATFRCENCLRFEAYAEEALRSRFPAELDRGRLTWSVLDFEEETNATLVDSYGIFESSLVVSEVRGNKERAWKKLEAIWSLVEDGQAFMDYVAAEVDSVLPDGPGGEIDDAEGVVPVHGQLVP